jgi:hypothetical protein
MVTVRLQSQQRGYSMVTVRLPSQQKQQRGNSMITVAAKLLP